MGKNLMEMFAESLKTGKEESQNSAFFEGVEAAMATGKIAEQAKDFTEGLLKELAYANHKHPGWPVNDAVHASAILNEEAGKLTQASIDHAYGHCPEEETTARMKEKALRVAAMALRFYVSLPEYKYETV